MPTNPFATEAAARIYAAGRPDYSSRVTELIRSQLGPTRNFRRAVDVGSGTGISTMALTRLADEVIGVEVSPAMLALSRSAANVTYRLGSAEDLPLDDGTCDLIGVGSAIHWFDRARFLEEASRVATPDAWLIVHDHWFTAQMDDDGEFSKWFQDTYLNRYPPPPRDRSWRPPDDLGSWRHVSWERYDHPISLDATGLARYLLTQSNLQSVMEPGHRSEEELRAWLLTETADFFPDEQESTFIFGGFVACHARHPSRGSSSGEA